MTARERILAIRLLEKQEKNPDYMKRIGVEVAVTAKSLQSKEVK